MQRIVCDMLSMSDWSARYEYEAVGEIAYNCSDCSSQQHIRVSLHAAPSNPI
jgi:hypothetical protein